MISIRAYRRALKLIDANIFIYAVGSQHTYKAPCRDVLRSIREGRIQAATNTEALQEVLYFYHGRGAVAFGATYVKRLLRTFPLVIEIDGRIIDRAASLVLSHPALTTRDLIHAAVTIEHGLEGIISADRGFDQIPGVRRFDPREM